MAIPKAKFIGLSGADPDAYALPRKGQGTAQVPLVPEDALAGRDQRVLASGLKYELDALANKDFR